MQHQRCSHSTCRGHSRVGVRLRVLWVVCCLELLLIRKSAFPPKFGRTSPVRCFTALRFPSSLAGAFDHLQRLKGQLELRQPLAVFKNRHALFDRQSMRGSSSGFMPPTAMAILVGGRRTRGGCNTSTGKAERLSLAIEARKLGSSEKAAIIAPDVCRSTSCSMAPWSSSMHSGSASRCRLCIVGWSIWARGAAPQGCVLCELRDRRSVAPVTSTGTWIARTPSRRSTLQP